MRRYDGREDIRTVRTACLLRLVTGHGTDEGALLAYHTIHGALAVSSALDQFHAREMTWMNISLR